MGKLNITKGSYEREISHVSGVDSLVESVGITAWRGLSEGRRHGRLIYYVSEPSEEDLFNAILFADAGNVYQLTGKLPSEMLVEIQKLKDDIHNKNSPS